MAKDYRAMKAEVLADIQKAMRQMMAKPRGEVVMEGSPQDMSTKDAMGEHHRGSDGLEVDVPNAIVEEGDGFEVNGVPVKRKKG